MNGIIPLELYNKVQNISGLSPRKSLQLYKNTWLNFYDGNSQMKKKIDQSHSKAKHLNL